MKRAFQNMKNLLKNENLAILSRKRMMEMYIWWYVDINIRDVSLMYK